MKTARRILALLFALLMIFSLSACGDDDDDVVLTTKKKTTTTTSADSGIDIWSYLNGDIEGDDTAEAGTIAYSGSYSGGGVSAYEDTPISFAGGSSVISSSNATTNKSGYPVIKWAAVSGAIKYNIYRSTNKSSGYTYLDSTTETSYTDKAAISGTQYYYQVKAVKKAPATTKTQTPTVTKKPTTDPVTVPSVTKRDMTGAPANGTVADSTNISSIVALYNASANQVKSKATSVTLQSRTIKYLESPSSEVQTILAIAGVKEGTSNNPHAYVGHDKVIAEFPIENSEISSTLTAGMVQSATSTYADGYYTLTITLKPDPEGTLNYSKTCTDVIDISGWYTGAYSTTKGVVIQARVSYNGYLDYVTHYVPTYIYVNNTGDGDNAVTVNTVVGISIQEFWSVNY